ncbi:MAG: c-type cytochrome biogenesis protein CcmI [Gammaproteobacteria bacterium]|jgi:cytochrome c-type biogenesis protein CcmH
MFILLTLALAIITVIFLLLPLFSKKQQQLVERDAVNVESAATKLAELKQELENGLINEEQFQQHQLEIETSTLEDLRDSANADIQKRSGNKAMAIIVALLVPLFTIAVYQQLGSEAAFDKTLQTAKQSISAEEIQKMVTILEEQVKNNPDDVDGRIALSQIYFQLERYNDATTIYSELNQLRPDDPDIMVNLAELLARSNGNSFIGKPAELLNKALTIAPNNGRALWFAGFAEQQAGNNDAAVAHWRQILVAMEEGSEVHQHLAKLIAETENSEAKAQTVASNQENEANQSSLQVTVSISEELQSKVEPNTTLFIFAKASEGPPMPLAVHRGLAKDLPITITLDDSMAMMPKMTLSSFPKVIVAARLSSNGQPQGQSGDFEGYSEEIEVSTTSEVDILINFIKP